MVNEKDATNSKPKAANKNKGKKKGGKGSKQSTIPQTMTRNSKKNQRSPTGGSPDGNLNKCLRTDDCMEIDASKVLDFGSPSPQDKTMTRRRDLDTPEGAAPEPTAITPDNQPDVLVVFMQHTP